ncbi:MAG: glycosyltransferase family 39 protein [Muribaculum sp.]|nr:glycosyltransferase family 39 protein [Muribaculum sp.]
MQALIFGLMFPVVPLLVWLGYHGDKRVAGRELLFRYIVYALTITCLTTLGLAVLSDEGTSFWAKMDASPVFVCKFAALELAAAAVVAAAEWMAVTRRFAVKVAWQEYRESGVGRFVERFLMPCGIYLLAAAVIALNISLMFDNVLWGDECFSANTARKDVDGILQVLYFWDNHPPLHYYWLKLFGELFGHTGPVYHLASLTPFFLGIGLALFFLRRRFGDLPAAFFIVITGVASSCLQYNQEIRMYSLAFLGVACCYYCAYRVAGGGKLAWFGMVFWALIAAYSHYYAMMTAGIIVFVTGAAAIVRFRGRTWIKSLLALIGFIGGYAPWLGYLFHATSNVSNNWWMTEIMGLGDSMRTVLCGPEFAKILGILLVVFLAALFLKESSFFQLQKSGENRTLTVRKPTLKDWSDETYGAAIGVLAIVGTLIAAYGLCLIVGPVLTHRYLYPLSAVTALLLAVCSGGCMRLVENLGGRMHRNGPRRLAKCVLAAALAVLLFIGFGNYRVYRTQVKTEEAVTEQALYIIGEVSEDTALVSNNVKHLAWTVLYYYYPDREVVTGRCDEEGKPYDRFWYFSPETVDSGQMQNMYDMGYTAAYYGSQQIATYPFELYYFER